ncbi:hypothetical protein AMAG_03195 [Allomyces macrogynus ATCC 38327]|uniref:Uncharacterized protein n=1 Tax=Allomyces macrogynus (strain ATCC 38327) TaxID=578462 RepID=A0A0L0S509_ALLM3|nr:hypothetical protein AMAG_03195 [Allomyces macrogynus ATCC 38327]|eukprot:KNE57486.1 hypothetical protein AMAG_03195 [Allomyces macrogynus ATCC 38327]
MTEIHTYELDVTIKNDHVTVTVTANHVVTHLYSGAVEDLDIDQHRALARLLSVANHTASEDLPREATFHATFNSTTDLAPDVVAYAQAALALPSYPQPQEVTSERVAPGSQDAPRPHGAHGNPHRGRGAFGRGDPRASMGRGADPRASMGRGDPRTSMGRGDPRASMGRGADPRASMGRGGPAFGRGRGMPGFGPHSGFPHHHPGHFHHPYGFPPHHHRGPFGRGMPPMPPMMGPHSFPPRPPMPGAAPWGHGCHPHRPWAQWQSASSSAPPSAERPVAVAVGKDVCAV